MSQRNGLRDKWRAAVLVNPDIDGETRAMLLVLYSWMTESGRVSVPRERLADMFDVDPRRITERIKRARDARLLDKVGGGFRGRTSIYDAVIPTGKVAVIPPPFSPNGGGPDTPFFRHLSTDTNRTERTGKVAVGTVPNARVTNVTMKTHRRERLLSHDTFRDAKSATKAYEAAEWGNRENERVEIVLVAADSIDTIMMTHGHYFKLSDSSLFSEFLPQG